VAAWGEHTLYRAWDTPMRWNRYCSIGVALIDRGRAVPLVGHGLAPGSSRVAYEE